MKWFIADEVAREIRGKLAAGLAPSREAVTEFTATMLDRPSADSAPPNLQIAGDVAQIEVAGVLTVRPDFVAWLFGYDNTLYGDIQAAVAIAEANPSIKRLQFNVNSPGGTVEGLFETLDAIDLAKKPKSVSTSFAASAGYAIASRGGKITARTAATEVGSIGVAVSLYADESIIEIASTQAPKKRPDVKTEEGKAIVREELDALHDLFVDAIAAGRGTTVADVNENFGQGGLLVAVEAKKRGMIDGIVRASLRTVPRASAETQPDATAADPVAGKTVAESSAATKPEAAPAGGAAQKKGKKMDLSTLKSEHPETYAAAVKLGREEGHAAGLSEGEAKERKRANAHLKMGTSCGDMSIAVAAVANGADFADAEVQAQYMDARMNRADQAARQRESDDAGAAVDGAAGTPEPKSAEDQAVDIYCAQFGIK